MEKLSKLTVTPLDDNSRNLPKCPLILITQSPTRWFTTRERDEVIEKL